MSSSISKKGLGRGLSSLMGDTKDASIQNETSNQETKISISNLKPSPSQPRRLFDKNSINELAESIKSKGLVQPILVRPHQQSLEHMKSLQVREDGERPKLHNFTKFLQLLEN